MPLQQSCKHSTVFQSYCVQEKETVECITFVDATSLKVFKVNVSDVPSLEVFKVWLDQALSNPI